MKAPRTEADLVQLIRDKVEESVSLDYKRAEALTKSKGDLTKEVTKDVSAFANSAGGILVYGVAEGSEADNHLPVSLSPIDRAAFSKERLEHLINNIQPRITDVEIIPIPLESGPNHVAYAVVVPASTTAHQCTDKRYYRRFNFEAVAMEDYEVRDVMNRRSLPKIELEATITFAIRTLSSGYPGSLMLGQREPESYPYNTITFSAKNIGGITAKHVVSFIKVPENFFKDNEGGSYEIRNFHTQPTGEYSYGHQKHGNPQRVPILPTLSLDLKYFELPLNLVPHNIPQFSIPWTAHCDEAPSRSGVFLETNIQIVVEEDYSIWLNEFQKKRTHSRLGS